MVDPELGFTSDVIRDPARFVGRTDLVRDCIQALSSPTGMIAVYGKRGVGKSSLLRQVQQMALGDYRLARSAGLEHELPERRRTYLTVHYSCDSLIADGTGLLSRLVNDQDAEDGLLRLVPNDGKEIIEFTRSKGVNVGADLKVVNWGASGVEASKYARTVPGDIVQTFRNMIESVVTHQVRSRMRRDSLLLLIDEFDVIRDKSGIGSLIKSLSGPSLKVGVCGIGRDLVELIRDHRSVERLLEQGAIFVRPMTHAESIAIVERAEELFKGQLRFDDDVKQQIARYSEGYPYFTQLLGKECVAVANKYNLTRITPAVFDEVLDSIRSGKSFPSLEAAYQRAIGKSEGRQLLLHLLAEQDEESIKTHDGIGRVVLRSVRRDAEDLDVQHVDQLLPRLLDQEFGPVLERVGEGQGIYEFVNPVFRLYVRLRRF